MLKSKYIELLRSLSKKHFSELEEYFNDHDDYFSIELFKHIAIHLPKKNAEEKLSREYVIHAVFKNKIDEKKLQKILNEGVKACEWIIIQSHIQEDKIQQHYILSDYYQKKSLDKYFKSQIQLLQDELHAMHENSSKYYMLHKLEHLSIQHELNYNQRYSNYAKLQEYLQTFYIIENQKLKCLSQINLHNTLEDAYVENKLHRIFEDLFQFISASEKGDYEQLWSYFISSSSLISDDELRTIAVIFINICIQQINTNHSEFYEHLLNAYIFLLDKELAFEMNGSLLPAFYKNVVTISLRLNKIDYAEQFAEQYKKFLPVENREDVYAYNIAHIYFYQRKFDDVLTLLAQSKFTDVFYKLSSRVLQIKTFTELTLDAENYMDILDSSLNAFKKYIYTNKEINAQYAMNYKNFYRIMVKITNTKKEEFETLNEEIAQLKPLTEVDWILSIHNRWYP